ncbi:SGNH/GDSL hydrolase family protein [Streptomyces sp. NBC_00370]|uniref:SGNH/GDSL hydrolase family protein n=1 Tax=Streptomyces sp. NBC_00370 TaxID=2975728 RepID=UPI002E2541F7
MTRRHGYALFGSLVGVVTLVCAAIFAGFTFLGPSPLRATDQSKNPGETHNRLSRAAPAASGAWVGSWAAAPAGAEPGLPNGLPGRSIRNVVHTSIGGTGARITFSNRFGSAPLMIGHASVAQQSQRSDPGSRSGGAQALTGTMRRLTFGRHAVVTVAPGRQIVSDPVRLRVPDDSDLLVTLYTPVAGGSVTYHAHAQQTSYLATGDRTEDAGGAAYTRPTTHWRYVTGVDVLNQRARGAVVTFGDSITDGQGSAQGRNHRWPDVLADRLRESRYGVLNEGIGGNQLLNDGLARGAGQSGLARFDSDVLDRAGVRTVVIDLGINDILRGQQRDPSRITAGLRALTRRAHAHGLRVVGSTLTPMGGHIGFDAGQRAVRDQVNAAIRAGGIFDSVVDFDKALRDPYAPDRLAPRYDSGDGLHPNDAGYEAMAHTVDLAQLTGKAAATQL